MKKIFILTLPIFVTIALIYAYYEKQFSVTSFLTFISNLRFNTFIDSLHQVGNNIQTVINNFKSIGSSKNILQAINRIINGLYYLIRSLYYILLSIFNVFNDLIGNVDKIYNYIFV